jgi:hypothetical protein
VLTDRLGWTILVNWRWDLRGHFSGLFGQPVERRVILLSLLVNGLAAVLLVFQDSVSKEASLASLTLFHFEGILRWYYITTYAIIFVVNIAVSIWLSLLHLLAVIIHLCTIEYNTLQLVGWLLLIRHVNSGWNLKQSWRLFDLLTLTTSRPLVWVFEFSTLLRLHGVCLFSHDTLYI